MIFLFIVIWLLLGYLGCRMMNSDYAVMDTYPSVILCLLLGGITLFAVTLIFLLENIKIENEFIKKIFGI